MEHLQMRHLYIILKAAAVVVVLLLAKWLIFHYGKEVITAGPVVTALVAGVIFTVAIIFSGVLADYKESEKIPGDLAASLGSLYSDVQFIQVKDQKITNDLRLHVKELLKVILSNFKRNIWEIKEIHPVMNHVAEDVNNLSKEGVAAPFIIKMRNELTTIDRISYRVEIIMETSFIPAAYNIAVIAMIAVLGVLAFTKMPSLYDGLLLFGSVSFILISLLLLIKDMDNPFEYGKKSSADVDLTILFDLEKELESRDK